MGAGSQLAAERDRWPFRWQVTDLDAEAEALLRELAPGEEIVVVVPTELGPPAASDGDAVAPAPPAALLALTDRRLLVVGTDRTRPADPAMVLASVPLDGHSAPAPAGPPEPLDLVIGDLVLRLDHADDAVRRFQRHLAARTSDV